MAWLRLRELVVLHVHQAADLERPVQGIPGLGEKWPPVMRRAGAGDEDALLAIARSGVVRASNNVVETTRCGHLASRAMRCPLPEARWT